MSTEMTDLNPNSTPPPPATSSSTKVLLGIGIGCAGVLILCCGGGAIATFWFSSWFQAGISNDPGTVRNVAAHIAQIDLPDEFEPTFSIDRAVPMSDKVMMRMAVFNEKKTESTVVLAAGAIIDAADPDQFQLQIRQSMGTQAGKQEPLQHVEATQKTLTVRGQPCNFTVAKGVGQESKKEWIQVVGFFPGQEGKAAIFVHADAKKYPEEAVLKIVQSIE